MLVAGSLGCAGRYANWSENHTGNVVVYTDAKLEHEYMQEWLQRSYTVYRALFPGIDPGKVDVVWLKSEPGAATRFYSPFDDPHAGWTLENLPSGSRIGRDGLIVLERREEMYPYGDTFRMRSVRDHELAKLQMAHLFVMHAVPSAPLWLQVGLSRYMSRYRVRYRNRYYEACFGSASFDEPILVHAQPAGAPGSSAGDGRRVLVSMRDLVTADWYRYDGDLRYWYEYTAYALVHYLIHGSGGFNRVRFTGFLRALRDGLSTEEALARSYPQVLPDEWDDLLADHVRPAYRWPTEAVRLAPGFCLRIPTEVEADFKPRRRKADPREIATLMEDLRRVSPFRRRGTWMPAEVVAAEAAKRPGKGGSGDQRPAGERTGPEDRSTPTLRDRP